MADDVNRLANMVKLDNALEIMTSVNVQYIYQTMLFWSLCCIIFGCIELVSIAYVITFKQCRYTTWYLSINKPLHVYPQWNRK